MTQSELQAIVNDAKSFVGCGHWTVFASFASAQELEGNLGEIVVCPERLTATVKVLHPGEPHDDPHPRDPRKDAAHEVFHLAYWMCEPEDWDSLQGKLIEQQIETLSQNYLRLLDGR